MNELAGAWLGKTIRMPAWQWQAGSIISATGRSLSSACYSHKTVGLSWATERWHEPFKFTDCAIGIPPSSGGTCPQRRPHFPSTFWPLDILGRCGVKELCAVIAGLLLLISSSVWQTQAVVSRYLKSDAILVLTSWVSSAGSGHLIVVRENRCLKSWNTTARLRAVSLKANEQSGRNLRRGIFLFTHAKIRNQETK